MLQIRRILVPLDFSELAEEGLLYARELADKFGAELDVVHVVEEPAFPSFYKLGAMRIYGMVPDQEKLAWTALRKRFSPDEEGVRLHVLRGAAESEIVRYATDRKVDLVVLTSHGLTGLQHVLLGSVAEKVTRHAPCPVLLVKVLRPGSKPAEANAAGKEGAASKA
ncbi:MAG: universal stress protein [Rhodothermales bacterium]|nr:universal stress protein [Rhodothermales bacterium]